MLGAGSAENAALEGRRCIVAARRRQFLFVVLDQGEDIEGWEFFSAVEEG
jgi:hypothetical protein